MPGIKITSPPSSIKLATTMVPGAPGYEEHVKHLEEAQLIRGKIVRGNTIYGLLDRFFNWINSALK